MNENIEMITKAFEEKRYLQAQLAAEKAVAEEPLNVMAWVYLGEALLHQEYGTAARKAFQRALLLDPEASWKQTVFKKLEDTPGGPEMKEIDPLLAVEPVRIAAVVIAKNDEHRIKRCLESLVPAVDEIVLVNYGSTDKTVEMASSVPKVRIVQTEWDNNFAAVRNAGLEGLEADWALFVDPDEVLYAEDVEAVRQAAGLFERFAGVKVLEILHVTTAESGLQRVDMKERLFPVNKGLSFHGRIYERVGRINEEGKWTHNFPHPIVNIRLEKERLEESELKKKDRVIGNLTMLRSMIEEEPDEPSWPLFYAREHLLAGGQIDEALRYLELAENRSDNAPEFDKILDVYVLQAKLNMQLGSTQAAELACRKALEQAPDYPDAHFLLAHIRMDQAVRLVANAEEHFRRAKAGFTTYRGTVPADDRIRSLLADLGIADLLLRSGQLAEAANIYRAYAANYPNMERITKMLAHIEEQQAALNKLSAESKPANGGEQA
ncbi:glycosyltransferase [Paenibacillus sp. y28]|uniref:glycosyltransferase n=1 Tax=Paenibacillus sp. y28 TaxID=3129110 RepID=UPI003017DD42